MAQNPQDVAAAWAQRLSASTDKISKGVAATTVAPGAAAARQKSVWQQNTAAAADKWATNVGKVTLAEWQTAMTDKGVQRIASGATAAQSKFADFMTQLLPHIDRVKAQLPARGNLDANINRMVAFSRAMSGFKKS